ncbi:transposase, Mutator family protein [Carnobacterium maltaromaticum LMA28]|uniref:Mutator family transposase n=1 Tax=Carnobacterium maltaromaticum LMA28 TaxID=1234679 RepID=K8EEY4_CARML|nr:IS256 family transposase [Carnobacterium maltaromaticum]CCO10348.2 transposase, Mutator family protein [Carnobacterium maltaromaticum LMA28]
MTQVHFTLNTEKVPRIIEYSIKDDVSKNILTTVFNQLMDNQRTEYIQAEHYERSENRQSQRNGYYERNYTTRVGTLELKVPRTRDGKFSPTIFERYHRNEKALLASMIEMYVSGVSTRKVSKIVEELCGKSVSKSFVSSLTEQLDPMVNECQNHLLSEKNYPYLMTDVLYIKVREENRVLSKSCHIAIGISKDGDREILGFMIQNEESEDTWSYFFEHLKNRGLRGTELVISDAHKGLVSAVRQSFLNASWQRCQVHFLRNILTSIPKKNSKPFREAVKAIFKFTDINLARVAKNRLVSDYIDQVKYSKACETLDNGFEDAFQYTLFGNVHNRLKSTNLLERLNQEVRRREKNIRIFANCVSANRLIGAVLIDQHDEWVCSSSKIY